MSSNELYDVIIIGGGLAGLSAAILLARKQHKVLVLEKEYYPKHKVCGEYISLESKPFLESLGLPVGDMRLPVINKLLVTDCNGNELNEQLPQGGFSISRYKLDAALAKLAEDAGAELLTRTKADEVIYENEVFTVKANNKIYKAKVACGTWGKRSNMDVKWQRPFIKQKNNALNNYIGIKYHVNYPWPADLVALHNFSDGYCGVLLVEEGRCCLCTLTTAANLQNCGNDIRQLELNVLMKNPWLNEIFRSVDSLYDAPVTISQVSFDKKEQVYGHVLLIGDTAGMITPLCGNGMSMAFHSAKIASALIDHFLSGRISRNEMEKKYTGAWKKNFSKRTILGRIVQSNFGKNNATSFFIKAMNHLPFLRKALVKGTSGRPF